MKNNLTFSDRYDILLNDSKEADFLLSNNKPQSRFRKPDRFLTVNRNVAFLFKKDMNKIKRICLTCKKEFYKYPFDVKIGRGKYCSKGCYVKAQIKPKIIKICPYCKKIFEIYPYLVKTRKFCSRKCRALGQPETIENLKQHRGTKPRTFHLRRRDKHGNAFDIEWRKKIYERDNYTCRKCGKRGYRLQAHHIKPYKSNLELRYDVNNGLTLCIDCHKKTDSYGWQNYWKNHFAKTRLLNTTKSMF